MAAKGVDEAAREQSRVGFILWPIRRLGRVLSSFLASASLGPLHQRRRRGRQQEQPGLRLSGRSPVPLAHGLEECCEDDMTRLAIVYHGLAMELSVTPPPSGPRTLTSCRQNALQYPSLAVTDTLRVFSVDIMHCHARRGAGAVRWHGQPVWRGVAQETSEHDQESKHDRWDGPFQPQSSTSR